MEQPGSKITWAITDNTGSRRSPRTAAANSAAARDDFTYSASMINVMIRVNAATTSATNTACHRRARFTSNQAQYRGFTTWRT